MFGVGLLESEPSTGSLVRDEPCIGAEETEVLPSDRAGINVEGPRLDGLEANEVEGNLTGKLVVDGVFSAEGLRVAILAPGGLRVGTPIAGALRVESPLTSALEVD